MVANVLGLCVVGARLGLWNTGLLKSTIVWLATIGLVTYVNVHRASSDRHFFRDVLLSTVALTVLLKFFLGLFVLSLWIELILQPLLAVVAAMSVVADSEARYATVKTLLNGVIAIVGIALLSYALFRLAADWQSIDVGKESRSLFLPVWLTAGTVPFFFAVSVYSTYEVAFVRLRFRAARRRLAWRVKLAMMLRFNIRIRELSGLHGPWLGRLGGATSFREAWRVVGEYRRESSSAPSDASAPRI